MKKLKKSLAVILAALILISVFSVSAGAAETAKEKTGGGTENIGDFTISYSEYNAWIESYNGTDTEITIPGNLGGYNVIGISDKAFYSNSTLEKVTIDDGIKTIGESAFYNCGALTEVEIKGADIIKREAFLICEKLKKVTLGDGLTTIEDRAFRGCTALEEINIPDSVTTIGDTVFRDDSSLKSLNLPAELTDLGYNVFLGCSNLESVTFPDKLAVIYENTFYNCSSLTEVIFPKSLTDIKASAFEGCTALTKVFYKGTISEWGNMVNIETGNEPILDAEKVYDYNGLEYNYEDNTDGTITLTRYNGSDSIITIPAELDGKSVSTIGDSLFNSNSSLTEVTISDGIKSIEGSAFGDCAALKSVKLPDSLEEIYGFAFSGCTALESIELPSALKVLGKGAFDGCASLSGIVIPEGLSGLGERTFADCGNLKSVTFKEGFKNLGKEVFLNCAFDEVTLSQSIESIGNYALGYNYDGIYYKSIENFKVKGYAGTCAQIYATDNAFEFEDLTPAPDYETEDISVTEVRIKKYLLTDVSDVIIPDKIEGKDVVEIAEGAFEGHNEIKTVTIPASVTRIEDGAFASCKKLEVFIVNESNSDYKTVDDNLYNKEGNKLIAYACGKTDDTFTVPDDVNTIAKKAFYGCDSLKEITVPNSVTNIEGEALGYYYDGVENTDRIYTDFVIKGYEGYPAEAYANANGITFEKLVEETTAPETTAPEDTTAPEETTASTEATETAPISGVSYDFDAETGTLTVTGTGAIPNYLEGEIPWQGKNLEDKVKKIVISGGITSIGNQAFEKFTEVEEVIIPDSVQTIGDNSFDECKKLKTVDFGKGVKTIGNGAFFDTAMTEAKLPASVSEIKYIGLGYYSESEGSAAMVDGFKIIAPEGSAAEQYAKEFGFVFAADGKVEPSETTSEGEFTVPSETTTSAPSKTYTFNYLPSDRQFKDGNGFILAIQDINGNLHTYVLEQSAVKLDGKPVYTVTAEIDYDVVSIMYQVYAGNVWLSQVTKSAADLTKVSGEVIKSDGSLYGEEKPTSTPAAKKANPVKITAKVKTVKAKKLKLKKQTVKPLTIKNAQGTVKVVKVKKGTTAKIYKYITVKAKTGAITFKKGKYAKKTYKVKLKITVSGNKSYKSKSVSKTVKIKVK